MRTKTIWTIGAGVAALTIALIALPGHAANPRAQESPDSKVQTFHFSMGEEAPSWLGVETQEVTAEKAREFKLPAERGALLVRIAPDSPAAKAGLKENDVVTEVNGQHVEGAAQFRRIIREIPSGRTVQLTVWRDGRSENLSATLGKSENLHHGVRSMNPGNFEFHMPDMPEVRELPEMPEIPEIPDMSDLPMVWDGAMMGGHPRLGIDAEDLNGQLGSFFGAPDGEGILVRGVNAGSPAEKAGLKAGDVITSLNGERIRSVGELRQKLSSHHEVKNDQDKKETSTTVKVGVLRNKSEMSLTVELPKLEPKTNHMISRRTHI